jgi:hypothetical protein
MDVPGREGTHSENQSSEHQGPSPDAHQTPKQTKEEADEENKRIRRLQIMMNMVMSVLSQEEMSLEEASELVANAKRAALAMFPDKELAYDLIYKPRLQRLLRERFRLQ